MWPVAYDILAKDPATVPAPAPQALVLGTGLLALVVVGVGWPVLGFCLTLAHEGSHALTGVAMGRRILTLRIWRKGGHHGGVTAFDASPGFLTTLAGYTGPSLFGLFGSVLVDRHPVAVLWLSVGFLFLALVNARGIVAILAALLAGAVIFLVLRYASVTTQVYVAHTWVWVLLIGGFVSVLELQRQRATGKDEGSDVVHLGAKTFLPASLWSGVLWLLTLAAVFVGAGIMLGEIRIGHA